MRPIVRVLCLLSVTSLWGCSSVQRSAECKLVESGFGPEGTVPIAVEEMASGLEVPWAIAFLPDGAILVTERAGRIRRVENGTLVPQPVATVDIGDTSEGGLLGLELHPDFATNRQFYIYYTRSAGEASENTVERWVLSEDGRSAQKDRDIIANIPAAKFHDGGRMRFGPDGMLYIGTGDAKETENSQDRSSLAGKILRVTPEGEVPADNPFNNPVWLLGIRNTQGFDWRDADTMIVSDHGPSGELLRTGHDEVTVARKGDNLGWADIYGCETKPGMLAPSLTWDGAVPPGGAAIYTSDAIPEWKGDFFMGTLESRHLHRVQFRPGTAEVALHETYLLGQFGRLREVKMGPDGHLYLTTSNCDGRGDCGPQKDKILRVVPGQSR